MNRQSNLRYLCRVTGTSLLLIASTVAADELASWSAQSELRTARAGAAVVEHNNVIYAIGGVDGKRYLSSVEYTAIAPNGDLSPWQFTSALPMPRGFADAAVVGEYVYVVGGAYGTHGDQIQSSVLRAPIHPDGSLGGWEAQTSLALPRRCVKVIADADQLYAIGGFAGQLLDSVESLDLSLNQSTGSWALLDARMLNRRYVHAAKRVGQQLFVMGGHHDEQGIGIDRVEWLDLNVRPYRFLATESLKTGRYGFAAFSKGSTLFAAGGISGSEFLDDIEMTEVTPSGAKGWTSVGFLPMPLANFAVIVKNQYVYVIGGTTLLDYHKKIWRTSFDSDGALRTSKRNSSQNAITEIALNHHGKVVTVFENASYTFIEIDSQQWIAAPRIDIKVGDSIRFSDGVLMTNYYSKSLQREFSSIRFVSRVTRTQ